MTPMESRGWKIEILYWLMNIHMQVAAIKSTTTNQYRIFINPSTAIQLQLTDLTLHRPSMPNLSVQTVKPSTDRPTRHCRHQAPAPRRSCRHQISLNSLNPGQ